MALVEEREAGVELDLPRPPVVRGFCGQVSVRAIEREELGEGERRRHG